jgi:hypothetical protein
VLEVSILAQRASRGGARVSSALRGTDGDDSKGLVSLPSRFPSVIALRGGLAAAGVAVVDPDGRRLPVAAPADVATWDGATIARLAGL